MKETILTLLLIVTLTMSYAQTKIIAHRGFSGVAPENTLISFQKAIDTGADYFELDVHGTIDDQVVVIHDASVDRTSSNDMKGKVSDMTYNDLTKVEVGYSKKYKNKYENLKIPTLRQALELAKGKIKVCIEIKAYGIEQEIMDIVNDLGMNDEVIMFSFYYQVLAKIRQLDKNIPILYLLGTADETTIDYAKVIDAQAIGVGSGTKLTAAYINWAHEEGVEVWRYTVNSKEEMKTLMDMGLDGLITDYPDIALSIAER